MTRFWTCSPVATRIGRDRPPDPRVPEDVVGARRLLDPPGVELAEARPSPRSPRRRPRPGSRPSSARRRRRGRRGSAPRGARPSRGPPHLHLHVMEAVRDRLPDERRHLLVVVAEPAGRGRVGGIAVASSSARAPPCPLAGCAGGRAPRPGRGRRRCSGSRSRRRGPPDRVRRAAARAGHPRLFAQRSQTALTTAPTARCMTPFSGPSQRSWPSDTSERQKPRMSPVIPSSVRPTTSGSSARMAATQTSVPRPFVKVSPWPVSSRPESVWRTT